MSEANEQARRLYRPDNGVNVLVIVEAPPANPQRCFYSADGGSRDLLYPGIMQSLYDEAREMDREELRSHRPEFLQRFKADGYYMIEACDEPMPRGATRAVKRRLLAASHAALEGKVRSLISSDARVVLIGSALHSACCERLRAAGFRVVNSGAIGAPAPNRQREFQSEFSRALDEALHDTIRSLEAAVRFFGAGEEQKRERERWIVEHFLRGLGLTFRGAEIVLPDGDPPDAIFRGASFEVKEVYEPGRRRGDEYKQQLAKARAASSLAELLEHFTPENISIAEVYRQIMARTRALAAGKYSTEAVRRSLDLLFYVNLGMRTAWGIDDGERPTIESLVSEGWRSVSFLHGSSTSCVIFAGQSAPEFLREVQGRMFHGEADLVADHRLDDAAI